MGSLKGTALLAASLCVFSMCACRAAWSRSFFSVNFRGLEGFTIRRYRSSSSSVSMYSWSDMLKRGERLVRVKIEILQTFALRERSKEEKKHFILMITVTETRKGLSGVEGALRWRLLRDAVCAGACISVTTRARNSQSRRFVSTVLPSLQLTTILEASRTTHRLTLLRRIEHTLPHVKHIAILLSNFIQLSIYIQGTQLRFCA